MTPTEDLIGEVLAARFRLGETWWPFPNATKPAASRMESAGLVDLTHGMVAGTYRARLTAKGLDVFISPTYQAPVVKQAIPPGVVATCSACGCAGARVALPDMCPVPILRQVTPHLAAVSLLLHTCNDRHLGGDDD